MQYMTKAVKAGLIISACLLNGMAIPAVAADLGVGVSLGGADGVDARVGASVGGSDGVGADVKASVGGSDGIDARTTASVGGGNGVNADVNANVGGSRGLNADVNASVGGTNAVGANVGVGIGGDTAATGRGTGGTSQGRIPTESELQRLLARMSANDRQAMMIRCRDITSSGGYDRSLTGLCRMLQSMASR